MMELINLERLSAITIASQLWQRPDIKHLIQKLFAGELKELEETWLKYFPKINDQSMDPSTPLSKEIETSFLRVRMIRTSISFKKSHRRYNKNFQIIIYSVLQHFESIRLPMKLKCYCQDVIGEMGEKIYNWIEYLTETLKLDFDFAARICWTPYGTVDESKILKTWESEGLLQRNKIPKPQLLNRIGCINPEDFTDDNQQEMEDFLKMHIPDFNINFFKDDEKVFTLIALFVHVHVRDNKLNAVRSNVIIRNLSGKYVTTPSMMFQMCVRAKLLKGASYFWNVMKDTADEKCLLIEGNNCLSRFQLGDKSVEMIIFLMDQMTAQQKNEFLQINAFKLFRLILPVWPYNEMIFQLTENFFSEASMDDYENIFKCIINQIKDNEAAFMKVKYFHLVYERILSGMPVKQKNEFLQKNATKLVCEMLPVLSFSELIFHLIDNFFSRVSIPDYQDIFKRILDLIKESQEAGLSVKYFHVVFEKIFGGLSEGKKEIFNSYFLHEDFKVFDAKCLNIILRDLDRNYRLNVIKRIPYRRFFLGKEGKIERLDEFMKQVLIYDDERNFYKDYLLGNIDLLLIRTDFEAVDKLFNYFSSSEEERAVIKNRINCMEFCQDFIMSQWRYDKAEKFLQWMFVDEEERDKFRYSLNDDWFIRERTYKSWDEMLQLVMQPRRDLRSDYYRFFFGFPEEIESVYNGEDFYSYREKLGDHFVEIYGKQSRIWDYDFKGLPDIFMKWVCKDEERRKAINRSYRDEKERILFCRIIEALLSLYCDDLLPERRKTMFDSALKLANRS